MKYLVLIIGLLFIAPAHAQTTDKRGYVKEEKFFSAPISSSANNDWGVYGWMANSKRERPGCVFEGVFKDGSYIHFVKDMSDGEFYVYLHNSQWSIVKGEDDAKKLRMNIYKGKSISHGTTVNWIVQDKNSIVIPKLNPRIMADAMYHFDAIFQLIMPGDVSNVKVAFNGREGMIQMAKCIKAFEAKGDKAPDISGTPKSSPADLAKRAREQI